MKLVSIIIPCYNYGWLLTETLDSVLAQTYTNWECIVIDDGSTDTTPEVAAWYQGLDPRFRYAYQANAGMSSARNHGLRKAKGEYIQFLDADDLLLPRKLEIQVNFLEQNSQVDIVYGDVRYFRHDEPAILSYSFDMLDKPWAVPLNGSGAPILQKMIEVNLIVTNAPLLRSSVLKLVKGFSEKLRAMEDWDFWIRCAAANKRFQYYDSPDVWTLVRVHPGSTSQNHRKMMNHVEKVRRQLQPLLKEFGDEQIIKRNKELLRFMELENARNNMIHGRIQDGVAGFIKLAFATGRVGYYTKSIVYWLKQRAARS